MSIPFPSGHYFSALQEGLNADPGSAEHLPANDAYCGFAVGEQLFVLEFDGHRCSAVVAGGNELDLDFVLAGPAEAWRTVIEGAAPLSALLEKGELEARSVDDEGARMATDALPFLQVFLDQSRGLEIEFL